MRLHNPAFQRPPLRFRPVRPVSPSLGRSPRKGGPVRSLRPVRPVSEECKLPSQRREKRPETGPSGLSKLFRHTNQGLVAPGFVKPALQALVAAGRFPERRPRVCTIPRSSEHLPAIQACKAGLTKPGAQPQERRPVRSLRPVRPVSEGCKMPSQRRAELPEVGPSGLSLRKRPTNPCPRRYPPAGRPRGGQRQSDGVVRWHRDGVGDALGFPGAVAISDLGNSA